MKWVLIGVLAAIGMRGQAQTFAEWFEQDAGDVAATQALYGIQ